MAVKKKLVGATKPRLQNAPLKGATRGAEIAELAEKIGMPLLPWQRYVLDDMMKVNAKNEYRRKTNLLLVARQAGKTHLARMRILWGLFYGDEKSIVAMSSNRGMAIDTFRQVVDVIESHDFLKAQVAQIRYANGQESVTLLNGNRYEIVAATRDGARGKTADLLYIDELREIDEACWTAARPIVRARHNSQILLTSNAGDFFSTVLNSLREMALSYPPATFGFWEYSAPEFCKLDDRKAWAMANPSMNILVDEEAIAEAIATSSVEATRTETLCQWVSALTSPWPYMAFEELAVKDLKIVAGLPTIFAMDVSPSRRNGSLVAGQLMEDGKIAVGVVAQFESNVAIDDLKMAAEIHKWALQYKPKLIAYDKYATMSIAERLTQSNQKCEDMSGQVFYQACGQLLDSVVSGRIVHNGSESLVASMNNCAAKTNDAGWRIIRRKSAGDVSAAIALAMVNHQLLKPQSKPMIMFDTP